jgi:uncharacterized membrane protein YvbJ
MFCKKCGEQIADDSQFCLRCGQAVNEPMQQQINEPSQITNTDKVQSGIQGIGVIVSIIMIIVAVFALMQTCE